MDPADEARAATARPDDDLVLFCPFCHESFEGESRCPEHDLALVEFQQLHKGRPGDVVGDDEPVSFHEPRFGRWPLALTSMLTMVAFFFPMLTIRYPDGDSFATGFQAASSVAANLWVVPAVAFTFLSILMRRRTPRAMRGSRLAVAALALLGLTSLGYTIYRVHAGATRGEQLYGLEVEVQVRWGAWLMAAGLVAAVVAGLRLGTPPPVQPPRYRVD